MALGSIFRSVPGAGAPPTAALSVGVNPTSLSGFGYGYGSVATDEPAILNIQGGSPPYSVLWTLVSGNASVTPQYATSPSTSFQSGSMNMVTRTAVWHATVTDAALTAVVSPSVSITLTAGANPP